MPFLISLLSLGKVRKGMKSLFTHLNVNSTEWKRDDFTNLLMMKFGLANSNSVGATTRQPLQSAGFHLPHLTFSHRGTHL